MVNQSRAPTDHDDLLTLYSELQKGRGRLNRQIVNDIAIAETTVKVHRSKAMQKVNVGSLPGFGRMEKLILICEKPQPS